MIEVSQLERATVGLLGELRKPLRVVLERLRKQLERKPTADAVEWERILERVGQRVLLPLLRKRYALLGTELAQQLRRWREQIALAQTESDLVADIGYFHMLHLQHVWRRYSARVVRRVAQRIVQDLQRGATLEEMMEAVGALLRHAQGYELERIVRTETTRYYNYAVVYETASYPEVAGYRYDVVVDDRTSDICRPLAGKVVARDQLKLVPPLHPNCRTMLVPLLESDMAQHEPLQAEAVHPLARAFGLMPSYLLRRLAEGHELTATPSQQFWRFWLTHEPSIRKLCFSLVAGDEARGSDLCSATMLRAYERFYMYDKRRSAFHTWVYNIAKGVMLNERAKSKREWLTTQFDEAEWDD